MGHRRVSVEDLGAWVIKGNADQADLLRRFEREPRVEAWCVQPGYRARMMTPGQRVVFWASGSRGRLPYGVWGVGEVARPVEPREGDRKPQVGLDLTIDRSRWVTRAQLRADARLTEIEVFTQPQGSNPSFLTVAQFEALREHWD